MSNSPADTGAHWANSFWARFAMCVAASYAPAILWATGYGWGTWLFSPIMGPLVLFWVDDTRAALFWLFIYFLILIAFSRALPRERYWSLIATMMIAVWAIAEGLLAAAMFVAFSSH